MQEGLKDLSMQERRIPTLELIREGILTLNPLREHQQCEVTTLGEDKNKNGKKNPETSRETHITGKKARKLGKKKAKLENLQEVTENKWKTSQDLNLVGIAGPRRMGLRPSKAI
jgi:hypothetical protein